MNANCEGTVEKFFKCCVLIALSICVHRIVLCLLNANGTQSATREDDVAQRAQRRCGDGIEKGIFYLNIAWNTESIAYK